MDGCGLSDVYEATLTLSDPPAYTTCPTPFLPEIIARWQEERRDIRAGLGLLSPILGTGEPGSPVTVYRLPFTDPLPPAAVAQHLPERVVQEDADLLMVYDNASMRPEAG